MTVKKVLGAIVLSIPFVIMLVTMFKADRHFKKAMFMQWFDDKLSKQYYDIHKRKSRYYGCLLLGQGLILAGVFWYLIKP
ncbi:hypothetical protein Tfer_0868 [Thermincola ferriacetica]|uniref:Uncharacterized protein n=1 Tax=Thermincola ferriacetica TaxID=281456 RepID=A0A0L6W4I7_9FIRM|nr:hypothetical protein [Thermincola ferriacetica]KNZ70308.1 hypothetical protein Tfer_0868 [Thermincola ferriacetica]